MHCRVKAGARVQPRPSTLSRTPAPRAPAGLQAACVQATGAQFDKAHTALGHRYRHAGIRVIPVAERASSALAPAPGQALGVQRACVPYAQADVHKCMIACHRHWHVRALCRLVVAQDAGIFICNTAAAAGVIWHSADLLLASRIAWGGQAHLPTAPQHHAFPLASKAQLCQLLVSITANKWPPATGTGVLEL